jgi:hypothetical protein
MASPDDESSTRDSPFPGWQSVQDRTEQDKSSAIALLLPRNRQSSLTIGYRPGMALPTFPRERVKQRRSRRRTIVKVFLKVGDRDGEE